MKGIKTGGRKAGTPNKVSGELRSKLKEILSTEIDGLPDLLDSLEPQKRAEVIARLLPLVIPRQLQADLGDGEEQEITVTLNLS